MSGTRQLVLEPIDDGAWRLSDRSIRSSDAASVIAYVERRPDGLYEVTWLISGVGAYIFRTLADLVRSAAAASRPVGNRSHATKPVPIAHRPPPLQAS